jgi:ribosome-binding protein aMBF1 (putative translation factor)
MVGDLLSTERQRRLEDQIRQEREKEKALQAIQADVATAIRDAVAKKGAAYEDLI